MKRIALALIACAGCGFLARSQKPSTCEKVAVVACTPAPTTPVVDIEPAVEQPQPKLIAKLLPGPFGPPPNDLSNGEVVRIYTENEAEIAAIWMEDESYTMRKAVELWLERKKASKAAPPALRDGQLSPRKQWRWSESQWAWVPVKTAGPAWVQDGHSATISHLVNEHGYSRSSLAKLTQSQLDVLHSNAHNAARAAAPVRSSGCPGGVCPSPSRSRGIFRRR